MKVIHGIHEEGLGTHEVDLITITVMSTRYTIREQDGKLIIRKTDFDGNENLTVLPCSTNQIVIH